MKYIISINSQLYPSQLGVCFVYFHAIYCRFNSAKLISKNKSCQVISYSDFVVLLVDDVIFFHTSQIPGKFPTKNQAGVRK